MVDLGIANSRMKDFFDVWFLCHEFEFQRVALANAIRATFERRQTLVPDEAPLALTEAFAWDAAKQSQWSAFLGRSGVADTKLTLPEVVAAITPFLSPAIRAAATGDSMQAIWTPGGPWNPQ